MLRGKPKFQVLSCRRWPWISRAIAIAAATTATGRRLVRRHHRYNAGLVPLEVLENNDGNGAACHRNFLPSKNFNERLPRKTNKCWSPLFIDRTVVINFYWEEEEDEGIDGHRRRPTQITKKDLVGDQVRGRVGQADTRNDPPLPYNVKVHHLWDYRHHHPRQQHYRMVV